MAHQDAIDVIEVMQVIIHERQARDRSWWDDLPRYYHPDARIQTSWFDGPVTGYIEHSKTMQAADPAQHRVGQSAIRVNGDRAVAEVPMTITMRGEIANVEADLTVHLRFLHRIERRGDGAWRLLVSTAIFEQDALTPAFPGTSLDLDAAALAGRRPSYRSLSLWLSGRGRQIDTDRYGVDRPEELEALYRQAFAWARLDPDAVA